MPDQYDRKILMELQNNGRMPMAELSDKVGLTTSPCWRRVRQMEESGVIEGYAAMVNPASVGIGLNVFVYVALNLHQAEEFEAEIMRRDEVVDCYAMTGDQDYLLHVMVRDVNHFDDFLRNDLIHFPGVDRVNSSFALKAIKKWSGIPVNLVE